MQMLIRLIQAKHVLEIGTFAGYSALAMALALPDDGRLIIAIIIKNGHAGPDFWRQANQEKKFELPLALHYKPCINSWKKALNTALILFLLMLTKN